MSKLVALCLAASPDYQQELPKPSALISPKSLPKLSEDDWQKSISQELRDIEEHKVEGDSLLSLSQEEKTKLQKEFCLACLENRFFGMEIWETRASMDLKVLSNYGEPRLRFWGVEHRRGDEAGAVVNRTSLGLELLDEP